jgi:taurine transport system substrate-binding protein
MKLASFAAIALMALACVLAAGPLSAHDDPPKLIRFGYLNGPRPWILGKLDRSFDKALGAPISWTAFGSGPPALEALGRGEIDVLRVGSVPLATAVVNQTPLKITAISGIIDTSERLVARSSIKSVKELENEAVGTIRGSTCHYALLAAMDVYGVDASKVNVVFLEAEDMLSAWEKGEISAAYVWGPWWHDLEKMDGRFLLNSGDLNTHGFYLFNAFVASADFSEKHPELLVNFLVTYQLMLDEYNRHQKLASSLIAFELGQDLEAAYETLQGLVYPPVDEQTGIEWLGDGKGREQPAIVKSLDDQLRFLSEQKLVDPKAVPESLEEYIDVSFLKKAAK